MKLLKFLPMQAWHFFYYHTMNEHSYCSTFSSLSQAFYLGILIIWGYVIASRCSNVWFPVCCMIIAFHVYSHLGLLRCPQGCPFRDVLLSCLISIGLWYKSFLRCSQIFSPSVWFVFWTPCQLTKGCFLSNTHFSLWIALLGLPLSHQQTRSSVFPPLLSCRDFIVMCFTFQSMICFDFD